MCGILGIFQSSLSHADLRKELINSSSTLRHRGPDWSGYIVVDADEAAGRKLSHGIAHERLAIMDPESGSQPLISRDGNVVVAANGEIYNYKDLYKSVTVPFEPRTGSDCESILALYAQHGPTPGLVQTMRGMFSFILYDKEKDLFCVVRDHIGITPLYIGWGNDGGVYVASELKALHASCNKFQQFPPGHMYCSKGPHANEFVRWFNPGWVVNPTGPLPTAKADLVRDAHCKICPALEAFFDFMIPRRCSSLILFVLHARSRSRTLY